MLGYFIYLFFSVCKYILLLSRTIMAEFQWSPAVLSNSQYKDFPALPVGGPPQISLLSTSKSKYKIPAEVFNPGRSHIDIDFSVPTAVALKHNFHLGKIMPVSQILWRHPNGTVLADCQYVAQQTSCVLPNLKIDEYASRTLTCSRFSQGTSNGCPYGEIIHPVKKPTYMIESAVDYKSGDDGKQIVGSGSSYVFGGSDGGQSLLPNLAGTTATPGVPSTGELAVATSIGPIFQAGVMFIKCRINFKDLVESMLCIDKDMFFGPQETELEITWRDTQHWGFETTGLAATNDASVTHSLAGSVPLSVVAALNSSAPGGGVAVQLATQLNPKIQDNVKAVWSSGDFSMLIPYQMVSSNALTASATLQTVTVPISGSPGSRLLRCWTVVNNPNDGSVYMSSNNLDKRVGVATNNTTVLYNKIRTALGSRYLQDNSLDVAQGEDYNWLRDKLRGSAVMDWDTFRQFSFFVDNFTSGSRSIDWQEENKDLGGLPNDSGILSYKVEVTLTNAAACIVYVLYTLQKTLRMTPSGPRID